MTSITVHQLRCEYRENPLGIQTMQPRFSWQLLTDKRDVLQTFYQIQVAKEDISFSNLVWNSGKVESRESAHIVYQGSTLESHTQYFYRVRIWDMEGNESRWSDVARFEMGLTHTQEWLAEWITSDPITPKAEEEACVYLRRSFSVTGSVQRARIYATSLGLYELHLNGERVGDWQLTPGWTSYHKRLQYQTYDATDLLHPGENVIGCTLGDGWYRGELAWEGHRNFYGSQRAALIQIQITYTDGTEQVVGTDEQWKTRPSPILLSSIYHGEVYDARLEIDGWSMPNFADEHWDPVRVLVLDMGNLVAQENLPTRIVQEMPPTEIVKTPNGDIVIDMGQNMVGWMSFSVRGEAGNTVTLEHAEVLDREGNFYTGNLRRAKQTIQYTCKGKGEEVFEPHFTFQGFRYVRVKGYPGEIRLENFVGKVVHTDMEQTGGFECSNEWVNRLQKNIVWGQKGNFVDVPTDCPQRDERLGWTGDAQVFIRTAAFNMNVIPFFSKWLRDLQADQFPNGAVPHVIPNVLSDEPQSSAAWGDASVICPWTMYLVYGDRRMLEEQYDSMKHWINYIRDQGDNPYLWNTGTHFGDWLALDAKENSYTGLTSKDFIATAFFAYSTDLLVHAAEVLQKTEDIRMYRELYQGIIDNFRREFVTQNGRLTEPTQTAHVLALMMDLVEPKDRQRVANTLAQLIEENHVHLTTGFVGTPYLCWVLSENGYHDLACKLVLQMDYPSWLYPVTKGSTTIWEHWDGIKEDGTFWSDDMNSFNHYAYGSIGDWLYRVLAGIDTDSTSPGYRHIHFRPHPGHGFNWVRSSLKTVYGMIRSEWEISENGQGVVLSVSVPANTTASVWLEGTSLADIQEGDLPIEGVIHGVHSTVQTQDGVQIEIGSGDYRFRYPLLHV